MEIVLKLISSNFIDLMFIIVAAIGSLIAYKTGNKKLVKKMILTFVVEAEKQLGSGTGELKYAKVVERFYEVMPTVLRMLYTEKQIDSLIEDAVIYLKRYLDNGKNLMGYDFENGHQKFV
ncbi:hypothetical protein [Desulfuribacillus alkaliarsenatis]|uniref:Holin n=1 Tax=Desulfuribacillus alkaliarsenatis TaxID=766136 RepID=A0A1E5G106_9FIRM|nr:hypothetical protein [Desulfuribacillus alkaliarsenatis]OEF96595.1 hypothetical protein BHF68_08090 [Desulfuribacillus alkaliarsenatis]